VSEEEEPPANVEEEEEEEPPLTSPMSRSMKPPPDAREEEWWAGASHLLHTRGRRSGAVAAGVSHLVARGRRSDAAQGRSKPPVVVTCLPLHDLQILANHR
jgi:hypothetical protein